MSKPIVVNTLPQSNRIIAVKKYIGENFPLPFHMHKKYELTLILKGSGTRIIGDNIDSFEAGEVVLLAPMIPHQWQNINISGTNSVQAISVFLDENFPSSDFQSLPIFQNIKQLLKLSGRGLFLTGNLKKRISDTLFEVENMDDMQLFISILQILNTIDQLREYELLSSENYIVNHNFDTDRISIITAYINKHIEKKVKLSELAELVKLHPGSLSREFKKLTGFNIIEYVNRIRLGRASRLLDDTDHSITDIAFKCGFQNLSHFNRQFKAIYKLTPSDFRKKKP